MLLEKIAKNGKIKTEQREELIIILSKIFSERHPNLLGIKKSRQTTKIPDFEIENDRISLTKVRLSKTVILYFNFVISGVSYQIKTLVFLNSDNSDSTRFELSIKDHFCVTGTRGGKERRFSRISTFKST